MRTFSHRRLFTARVPSPGRGGAPLQDGVQAPDGRTISFKERPHIAATKSSDEAAFSHGQPWAHADTPDRGTAGAWGPGTAASPLDGEGEAEDEEAVKAALAESPLLLRRLEPQVAAALVQDPEGFCPCLFRLRIPKVAVGGTVQVRITYLETMRLQPGAFNEVVVPLTIPWDCLPPDMPLHEVVRVSCMINSGIHQPMKIGDFNHPMKVLFVELGRATFVGYPDAEDPDSWPNTHFTASYQVVSDEAHAGALVQAPVIAAHDSRATFCLTICLPDTATTPKPLFRRAVVFVIDSNSSLRSKQMDDARRAIASALKRLDPNDLFLLVAFDYELLTSADDLEPATPENVKRACKFILRAHDCESPSNIFTPLDLAFQMLRNHSEKQKADQEAAQASAPPRHHPPLVPQVVLVTDGSVQDERRICQHIQAVLLEWGRNPPRIFTFGIGPHCNFYFLKWLASVSRGVTDMAYNLEEVRSRLDRLLHSISRPMVMNVTIKELPHSCELYPFPIPDLYLGVPVVVTGKMGAMDEEAADVAQEFGLPSHLHLRGVHSDGSSWRCKAQLAEAGNVPLNSVGIKEQLEILTADAWLHQDSTIEETVTNLSVSASVPAEGTSMVYFETKNNFFQEFQRHRVQGVRSDIRTYTDPGSPYLIQVPGLSRGYGRSSLRAGVKEDEVEATATSSKGPRVLQSRQSIRENMGNGGLAPQHMIDEDAREEEMLPKETLEKMASLQVTRHKSLFSGLNCYQPKGV